VKTLWPSLLMSALIAGLALLAAAHLTEGFACWTYEDLRRARAGRLELQAPALQLRTADGRLWRPWSPGQGGDALYLVDFIYTRCPSVCRALGSEYQQMQAALRETGSRVHLLSLSFDIAHDDPAALAAYGRLYRAEAGRWTVAVPRSPEDLARLLTQLGVVALPDGRGGYVHNGALHLIAADGRLLAIHDYPDWQAALAVAQAHAEAPR